MAGAANLTADNTGRLFGDVEQQAVINAWQQVGIVVSRVGLDAASTSTEATAVGSPMKQRIENPRKQRIENETNAAAFPCRILRGCTPCAARLVARRGLSRAMPKIGKLSRQPWRHRP